MRDCGALSDMLLQATRSVQRVCYDVSVMTNEEASVTVELAEGLSAWEASNDVGQPWCVMGGEDGFSVNLYVQAGAIRGVEIADGPNVVSGYGLVPYREEK